MRHRQLTLSEAIQTFLQFCEAKNLSEETISWYGRKLQGSAGRLGDRPVEEITTGELRDFVLYLSRDHVPYPNLPKREDRGRRGLAPNTVNGYIRALKALFRFLVDEELLETSPATKLLQLKTPQHSGDSLTWDELQRLIRAAKRPGFTGRRNHLLVLVLADTGVRIGEALRLQVSDVNWAERTLSVFGKGAKVRHVPFGSTTARALTVYLSHHPSGDVGDSPLLVTARGDRLEKRHTQRILKALACQAGIVGKSVSPHVLRRTFATQWISNGGDPFSLQRILGHTTMEMVNRYVRMSSGDLRHRHAQVGLLERLTRRGG